MSDFVLSCCSPADLTKEYLDKRDIRYICFHIELGHDAYEDDLGVSVPPAELYRRMVAGEDAKTSQVNVQEYATFFEEILREGKDILHVSLSSGISSTFNSASVARNQVAEKYPDRKIYVVDSLAASSGYGLLMDALADLRDEGKSIEEIRDWAEANKKRLHHWFFSTDLTFYIKGGRVTKTAGFFGNMLNICPLLNVDYKGRLIPREKHRGKKKVIRETVQKMLEHAENGADYTGKCFISQSECLDDAKAVAEGIEANHPKMNGKVQIFPIGATIGCHTGPGTVALFFWGDERVD